MPAVSFYLNQNILDAVRARAKAQKIPVSTIIRKAVEHYLEIAETKAADQMNSAEVQDKRHAAVRYCKYASDFTSENGGKAWKYLLIPHNEVQQNNSFSFFVGRFIEKNLEII